MFSEKLLALIHRLDSKSCSHCIPTAYFFPKNMAHMDGRGIVRQNLGILELGGEMVTGLGDAAGVVVAGFAAVEEAAVVVVDEADAAAELVPVPVADCESELAGVASLAGVGVEVGDIAGAGEACVGDGDVDVDGVTVSLAATGTVVVGAVEDRAGVVTGECVPFAARGALRMIAASSLLMLGLCMDQHVRCCERFIKDIYGKL